MQYYNHLHFTLDKNPIATTMKILVIFLTILQIQPALSFSNQTFLFSYTVRSEKDDQYNLYNLLGSLTSQASKATSGFYNNSTTSGQTPNQLYGLYHCRGDLDPQACGDCVNEAKLTILNKHPYGIGREGSFWYNHCMVRYSNESFFGKLNVTLWSSSWNNNKIKGISRFQFGLILRDVMNALAVQASNDKSGKKFAMKVVDFAKYQYSLYAMVECTPDLKASDCYKCLNNAIGKLRGMRGSPSGHVLSLSCMVQYETSPFFGSRAKSLPSPSFLEVENSTLITLSLNVASLPQDHDADLSTTEAYSA